MTWSLDDPLLWGGVFLLVFVVEVIVIMNLKAQRQKPGYEPPSREAVLPEGEELTDILSRFVEDKDGEAIGETVGMDGDLVVVKAKGEVKYLALPRIALSAQQDSFRVTGTVDWGEAEAQGQAWKERQHRLVEYSDDELPQDETDEEEGARGE